MLPDRVSNPGPLTYKSGALPIALCGPAPSSSEPTDNLNFLGPENLPYDMGSLR